MVVTQPTMITRPMAGQTVNTARPSSSQRAPPNPPVHVPQNVANTTPRTPGVKKKYSLLAGLPKVRPRFSRWDSVAALMSRPQSQKKLCCKLCPGLVIFNTKRELKEVPQVVACYVTDDLLKIFTSTGDRVTHPLKR